MSESEPEPQAAPKPGSASAPPTPAAKPGEISNLLARFLTAVVAIPLLLLAIFARDPIWVWAVVTFAIAVGLREWVRMTMPDAPAPERAFGVVLGTLLSAALYWLGDRPGAVAMAGAAATLATFLWFLGRYGEMDKVATRIAFTLAGYSYVGLLLFLALLKRNLHGDGAWWVFMSLGVAWLSDTGAYFAGRFIGPYWPRKLYESVSPKKTLVGGLGGIAGSYLVVLGCKLLFLPHLSWADTVLIAVPANLLGQAGDLCESLIKRSVGVKDSGALLPGHGGMLDRIDALLFVVPYLYAYATWILVAR